MSFDFPQVNIEDFYRRIMPRAPGAPEPLVNQAIIDASREFCRRTRCWRETDPGLPTSGDETEIICVPPMCSLYEIDAAYFNGRPLEPRAWSSTWDYDSGDGTGQPEFITQSSQNSVMLVPRGTGTLRISMYLMPAEGADILPGLLLDQYGEAVSYGALMNILGLPGQPYSNAELALYYGEAFERKANENFASHMKGQQRAVVRTRSAPF